MMQEKERLKAECRYYEDKFRGHLETLVENPVQMTINSILPFEKGVKEGVMTLIQLMSGTILPVVLGATMKKGKDPWTKNIIQIVQALVISAAFKYFKNRIQKKKAAEAAAAASNE
jgi:hypothetical protein